MANNESAEEVARRLGVPSHPIVEQATEAVARFAPLGWAVHGRWNQPGTVRALRLAAGGASDKEIDEALTEMWNSDNRALLRHAAAPIRSWSNSYRPLKQVLWGRVALIEKAIDHHFAGAYEASIPILLAQADGMAFDLTGRTFFSKQNSDLYVDDETLAGMANSLPVVRGIFSDWVTDTGSHGLLSRHGILHGRDLGYATKVNSTKTIVLVGALAEYFPQAVEDVGARLRREHDKKVAGSTELDEKGRLTDDRQVHELQNFAYELNIAYAKGLLVPFHHFDLHAETRKLAEKHGLDATGFASKQDATGVWWHYTLPSEQTLGYAARPTTSDERKHPDVWRWDARYTPLKPPWEDADGWRSDDDRPGLPNWEPDLII